MALGYQAAGDLEGADVPVFIEADGWETQHAVAVSVGVCVVSESVKLQDGPAALAAFLRSQTNPSGHSVGGAQVHLRPGSEVLRCAGRTSLRSPRARPRWDGHESRSHISDILRGRVAEFG